MHTDRGARAHYDRTIDKALNISTIISQRGNSVSSAQRANHGQEALIVDRRLTFGNDHISKRQFTQSF